MKITIMALILFMFTFQTSGNASPRSERFGYGKSLSLCVQDAFFKLMKKSKKQYQAGFHIDVPEPSEKDKEALVFSTGYAGSHVGISGSLCKNTQSVPISGWAQVGYRNDAATPTQGLKCVIYEGNVIDINTNQALFKILFLPPHQLQIPNSDGSYGELDWK